MSAFPSFSAVCIFQLHSAGVGSRRLYTKLRSSERNVGITYPCGHKGGACKGRMFQERPAWRNGRGLAQMAHRDHWLRFRRAAAETKRRIVLRGRPCNSPMVNFDTCKTFFHTFYIIFSKIMKLFFWMPQPAGSRRAASQAPGAAGRSKGRPRGAGRPRATGAVARKMETKQTAS
jgi:hypothetical protein